MPDGDPNVRAGTFARLHPCDVDWFERAAAGIRLRGAKIECDTRSQGVGRLKRMLDESSAEPAETKAQLAALSLTKRFCGDWRHAA